MPIKTVSAKTRVKTKKPRSSGVTVTKIKRRMFCMKACGPSAPDLRTVLPALFGMKPTLPPDDEECRTCIGHGRIRDGETLELRRCLDCSGTGSAR